MSSLGVTTAVRERVEAVRVGPGRAVTAPPPCPPGMRRHLPYTLPGLWFALLFTCLSFTPSLLPRSGLVQGLVCGINAAIGYGLGVFAAAAWRAVADRDARTPRQTSWALLAVAAAVSLPVALVLGRYWQDRIRELMGVATDPPASSLLLLPVAAVVPFVALVAAARGLRWLYRHLDRRLRRWIGPRAADVLTGAVIVIGTVLVVNGVLVDGAVRVADRVFSLQNQNTDPGVTPPTSDLRSGGPGLARDLGLAGPLRPIVRRGRTVGDRDRAGRGRHRTDPDPRLRRPRLGRRRRGTGPPGRRRPRTGRRVLPLGAGGRHHHRLRVDRPGLTGHAGVPDRGRHRDGDDAVLLPAVVAVVPGGPGPRTRRRPGAVRRRLRPLVGACRRTPVRACSSAGRASARSARRPRSAGSST